MKIGVVFFKYPLYPNGSYFQEFLNELAKKVHQINLIACRHPKGKFKSRRNINFFWLPLIKIDFLGEIVFMFSALLKVIFTKNLHHLELINVVGPRGLLAAWYLKNIYGTKVVCTLEMLNEPGIGFKKIHYNFIKFLLTAAPIDKFICWSNFCWENHLKIWGVSKNKVVIIPAGINLKAYSAKINGNKIKQEYAPKSFLIVFAKPLYSTNIEAAKILVRSIACLYPKIKIRLLVGGGKGKSEVKKTARDLGILNQVNFIPQTPFTQIPKYIAAADLIVLPFTYAPTVSRSLLEAMALGKPIITNPVGELKFLFRHKKEVLFCELVPQKIARAISFLLQNKSLADKIGKTAREAVVKSFSLERSCDETIKTISLLVK